MTELTIHQPGELAAQMDYAKAAATSDLLPQAYRGKPANVLIAVGLGQAMGLSPAESLYRIDVIQGKPTASAELIAANVRRAGHKLRVRVDEQATSATAIIVRADDPGYEHTVTRDMAWAKQMGLASKDNYKKQPTTMLQWRAISAVARQACPEALYGVAYTPDELADTEPPAPAQPSERSATATLRNVVAPAAAASHPDAADDATPVADAINQDRDEAAEAAPSQAQVGRMFALFGEVLTDVPDARTNEGRAARLAYIAAVIGHEVESSKDLTIAETSAVIDSLEADKQAAQTTDEDFAAAAGETDPWEPQE